MFEEAEKDHASTAGSKEYISMINELAAYYEI